MDINEIFESIKKNRKVIFDLKTVDFGCFVLIGSIQGKVTNFENNVGYLVQIRERQGDYGTDRVLVRHPNGRVKLHENQNFNKVDEHSAMLMLPYFNTIPGQELISKNFNIEFDIDGKVEKGFYIDFEK